MSTAVSLLHNTLRIMAPLLLAATGGLFTEMAGILNIALEGLMLTAAFTSVWITGTTGSLLLGCAGGIFSSVLLSSLFAFSCLKLKANIFVAGIATNLLASGIVTVSASRVFGHKGVHRFVEFPSLFRFPALEGWLGVFGDQTLFVYGSWFLLLLAGLSLFRSPFGLRLRGVGQDSRTARTVGIDPSRYRGAAILISGAACGLAGCALSLNIGAHVPYVTAGRGWIALVVIFLGNRRPLGIFAASFIFALAESLSNYSQGILSTAPELILAFPYLISLAALIFHSAWKHYRTR